MRGNMSLRAVLVLSVAAAILVLTATPAGAADITVLNPGMEERLVFEPTFADGQDKYNQWSKEYWRHWQRTDNGGPIRIWNPGPPGSAGEGFGGIAAEGSITARVSSRYSDGLNFTEGATPGSTIRFEAATQLLSATLFSPDMVYTLSAALGNWRGGVYWGGYAVQLAAGGVNVSGATYGGSVTGGTLLAQDVDSLVAPVNTWITSTVTFRPNQAAATLAGQAL